MNFLIKNVFLISYFYNIILILLITIIFKLFIKFLLNFINIKFYFFN